MARIVGGSGSDFLIGRVGESDEIIGGDGNDTITSTAPNINSFNGLVQGDFIFGGNGDDVIIKNNEFGDTAGTQQYNGSFNDFGTIAQGDGGNDTFFISGDGDFKGGAGNDTFVMGHQRIVNTDIRGTIEGGSGGFDTLNLSNLVNQGYTVDIEYRGFDLTSGTIRIYDPTQSNLNTEVGDFDFRGIENIVTGGPSILPPGAINPGTIGTGPVTTGRAEIDFVQTGATIVGTGGRDDIDGTNGNDIFTAVPNGQTTNFGGIPLSDGDDFRGLGGDDIFIKNNVFEDTFGVVQQDVFGTDLEAELTTNDTGVTFFGGDGNDTFFINGDGFFEGENGNDTFILGSETINFKGLNGLITGDFGVPGFDVIDVSGLQNQGFVVHVDFAGTSAFGQNGKITISETGVASVDATIGIYYFKFIDEIRGDGVTFVPPGEGPDPELTIAPAPDAPIDPATGNPLTAENGAPAQIVITRNGPTDQPLVVTLTDGDPSETDAPATVTIPAGQSSITVDIPSVDDPIVDGPQISTITASAPGFPAASQNVTVADDDTIAPTGTVVGNVFTDTNGDNTEFADVGFEPGINGLTVVAKDLAGNIVASTTTFGNGNYELTGVPAGDVIIEVPTSVDGQGLVTPNVGADSEDSDGDPATGQALVNVPAGGTLGQVDFGYTDAPAPTGTVVGNVFTDTNGDNTEFADVGFEPGINGLTVVAKDLAGNIVATTTTFGNGNYELTGVPAGDVIIEVPTSVGGQGLVTPNVGADSEDSDGDPATGQAFVNVPAGGTLAQVDFGYTDAPDPVLTIEPAPGTPTDPATGNPLTAENGPPAQVVITRNGPTDSDLTVFLSDTDPSETNAPFSVVIPAGQSSVIADIPSVDDPIVDGTQNVTIIADASGFPQTSFTVSVADDDEAPTAVTQVYLGNFAPTDPAQGVNLVSENADILLQKFTDISAEIVDYGVAPNLPVSPDSVFGTNPNAFTDDDSVLGNSTGQQMDYDIGNGLVNSTVDDVLRFNADFTMEDGTTYTGVDVAIYQSEEGDVFLETWVFANVNLVLDPVNTNDGRIQTGTGGELLDQPITHIELTEVTNRNLDSRILNSFPAEVAPIVNLPPDAVDDPGNVAKANEPIILDVLDNDTDPENDPLTITDATLNDPSLGTVEIVNNQIVYTPSDDAVGITAEITYDITDGNGGTDSAVAFTFVLPADPDPELTITPTGPIDPETGNPLTAENGAPAQIVIERNGPTDQPLVVTTLTEDVGIRRITPDGCAGRATR